MKRKIKWGNWCVLLMFIVSAGVFMYDCFMTYVMGYTLTWLGLFTGGINFFILMAASMYIYDEVFYEEV